MLKAHSPWGGVAQSHHADDRIHHFDYEPHGDWDDLKHGLFERRTQRVLSGRNVFYLRLPRQRLH
jgi:hypothetical protein